MAVERVHVVVVAPFGGDGVGELGPEAQGVDLVGEGVADRGVEVVVQIVYVHVAIAEAAPGRDVEVADDLVDAQVAFDAAPFAPLLVETLTIAFAFALLDAFAATEGPAVGGVGFADIVAGVAAAGFLGVRRGWC